MARVDYDSIVKQYGDTIAVEDVDITVEDGEFAVLLGPSGCGKTTTLRCLAGLTEPTSGTITLDDYDVTDVHPKNRNIAMVFQQFALYPHMNVRENIGYPLKVAGEDKQTRHERVEETAKMLEIEELLDREIGHLSGGQRQRVALGRAIIRRPAVFLMDEPLASLDAKLKISMRSRIKVLQKDLGITTLYVTHDQEEAMTLGDKLIVMNNANVQQVGSPDEVYHEPANRFVAGFIGSPSMNFVTATIDDDGRIREASSIEGFNVKLTDHVAQRYRGHDRFELGVRPSYFVAHTSRTENAIEGTVQVTEPLGDEQILDVVVGDEDGDHVELTVKVPNTMDFERKDDIWLTLQDELVHGFDVQTGDRIGDADRVQRMQGSPETERTPQ
ncbi:ABC transporter ATP-binding protein [Haladaptatus halobius]|uniref:ABC transporter ATP-binding protein n=1 Tax=Haladaptatus halobius TaxID=2884875 RepID=UPI001D0AC638|nr:ABC transporter ATP-binding protein [Haladaptatus halobius]